MELSALIHIHLTDSVTPHAIATRLSLTTGSVTALLDRLQGAGLIAHHANPDDRRSLLIVGTPAGDHMAQTFLASLDDVVSKAIGELDVVVVEQLRNVLQAVTVGMEQQPATALAAAGSNGRAH